MTSSSRATRRPTAGCRTWRGPPFGDGIVLKAKDVWPRTGKPYCHRAEGGPELPDILEQIPTRGTTYP